MFEIEKYKKILDDYANKYINLMEKKKIKHLFLLNFHIHIE